MMQNQLIAFFQFFLVSELKYIIFLSKLQMSIFDLTSIKHSLPGFLKVEENFASFVVKQTLLVKALQTTLDKINENLKKKNIAGEIEFCKFVNHGGKHLERILVLNINLRSTHCNLYVLRMARRLLQKSCLYEWQIRNA